MTRYAFVNAAARVNDGPNGRDYCGSGGSYKAHIWLVACDAGYQFKVRKGPDQCEPDPRWMRR